MFNEKNDFFERGTPSKEQLGESIAVLDKNITQYLLEKQDAAEKKSRIMKSILAPFQQPNVLDEKAFAKALTVFKDWTKGDFETRRLKFTDSLDIHSRIAELRRIDRSLVLLGPPYDLEFRNGDGSYADANNAEFGASGRGNLSAGLGIYISATRDVQVRVTAYLPVNYSWITIVNHGGDSSLKDHNGFASVFGAMKVSIDPTTGFGEGDQNLAIGQLFYHRQDIPHVTEEPGTSTTLGFTDASETYVNMKAGKTYVIAFSCMISALHNDDDTNYSRASISCTLPFIVLKPVS